MFEAAAYRVVLASPLGSEKMDINFYQLIHVFFIVSYLLP